MAKQSATTKAKKPAASAKTPLQKQVDKTVKSGQALERAKHTHAENQKELKRLQEVK